MVNRDKVLRRQGFHLNLLISGWRRQQDKEIVSVVWTSAVNIKIKRRYCGHLGLIDYTVCSSIQFKCHFFLQRNKKNNKTNSVYIFGHVTCLCAISRFSDPGNMSRI